MKLLILTQKVDKNDPILGFFHGWILEFAQKIDSVIVICLEKGEYDLPSNVKVLSLGKENGRSRLKYIFNFYKYIWQERKNYDTVFVHMNQEYILLGALVWKLWHKAIFLWRNHPVGDYRTKISVWMSNVVLCTSGFSYTAQFSKTVIMPVGINTEVFKRDKNIKRQPRSVLVFGRISPVKKLDVFLEACFLLKEKNIIFKADIVGDALPIHKDYYDKLKKRAENIKEIVSFKSAISNIEAPKLYNKYEIYVNMTTSGSFDKTIFEAMATESLVIGSNQSLVSILDNSFLFKENDPQSLADCLEDALNIEEKRKEIIGQKERLKVKNSHDLKLLISKFLGIRQNLDNCN